VSGPDPSGGRPTEIYHQPPTTERDHAQATHS
jgi:hypothetical protein